jgi:hypothetical protein
MSLARLAVLLHRYDARVRTMAVFDLAGHFDEAGTHAASNVVVVAGYVAPATEWKEMEKGWLEALRDQGAGVRFYHTTDIEADPPRGIYKSWSREKADGLTDAVVPVAAKYAGRGFAVHVATADWYSVMPIVKEKLPNRPHDVLFQILAKSCMEAVIDDQIVKDLPADETVAFIFEDNDFSEVTLQGYRTLRQNHSLAHRFGALAFEPDKSKVAGLQAADLLAWHYRRVTEIRRGFRQGPIHRCVRQLFRPDFVLRFLTREMLEARVFEAMGKIADDTISRYESADRAFEKELERIAESQTKKT